MLVSLQDYANQVKMLGCKEELQLEVNEDTKITKHSKSRN